MKRQLTDKHILELAEPFGAFEFGDAQGHKRLAFARTVISAQDAVPQAAQTEATSDPFSDIRDKRVGDLAPEQFDRATEFWLRNQIGPSETYWFPHLQVLFRIIDRLRASLRSQPQESLDIRVQSDLFRRMERAAQACKTLPPGDDWVEAVENFFRNGAQR